MKIYTRTGDEGTTGLFGGGRVQKDHPRIAAYGTVDETNSLVGMARAHLRSLDAEETPAGISLDALLRHLQEDLFTVGADLATPVGSKPVVPRIEDDHVEQLETHIDAFQRELPELKQFILPGGAPGGATLHAARTTCRRAERLAVRAEAADEEAALNHHALVYLNRLSDLFFVLARWANRQAGEHEDRWSPEGPPPQ